MRFIATAAIALSVIAGPALAAPSSSGCKPVPEEQGLTEMELRELDPQEVARRQEERVRARRKALLEWLICSDKELRDLDAKMVKAYWDAVKRAGRYSTVALRNDQRAYDESSLEGVDYLLNDAAPKANSKQGGERGEGRRYGRGAAVKELKARLSDRIKVLNAFEPDRDGFEGEWRSQSGRLEIKKSGSGYKISAFTSTFGWTRYWCQAEGLARLGDRGMIADAKDPSNKPRQLRLRFKGAGLASHTLGTGEGDFCPQGGELDKTVYFIPVRPLLAEADKDQARVRRRNRTARVRARPRQRRAGRSVVGRLFRLLTPAGIR